MTLIYSKTPVYSSVKRPNISMMMTTSSYNVSSSLNTNKIVNSYNISSKMGMATFRLSSTFGPNGVAHVR